MILFAAGMVTGAFITVVVSLILAARIGDERIRRLYEQDELYRQLKSETPNEGHR